MPITNAAVLQKKRAQVAPAFGQRPPRRSFPSEVKKRKGEIMAPALDNIRKEEGVLDFSFYRLTNVQEMLEDDTPQVTTTDIFERLIKEQLTEHEHGANSAAKEVKEVTKTDALVLKVNNKTRPLFLLLFLLLLSRLGLQLI